MKQIKVGIVGTSFGAVFIPLFRAHPNVRAVAIADLMPERLQYAQDLYGALETFPTLDEMLASDVDAVCIFTQRWMHAKQAIQAMKAGKHVYSAVPAAVTPEDMVALIETVKSTGQMYMLGETSYYYPAAFFCREKLANGEFGQFVYAEGEYLHDMSHGFYEAYMWSNGDAWKKFASFPPMLYATHSVGMIVATTNERLTRVSCLGYKDREDDGVFLRDVSAWQNEFSNQSALFRTASGGMARINEFRRVGWSENGNATSVRLSIYGTKGSYEEQGNGKVWNRVDSEEPVDVTAELRCEQMDVSEEERAGTPEMLIRDYHTGFAQVQPRDRLPKEFYGLNNGHEGSHQYLVDDFVRACVTMELPPNNVWQAARYNVPGMIAHQSALKDGESLAIPDFGEPPKA